MKEFGGYFPIELKSGSEYYMTCSDYKVRRCNSGRSAIFEAVIDSGAGCVWLPVYLCDSVRELLEGLGVVVRSYNIGEDFMPVGLKPSSNDIVIYTNYYGIQSQENLERVLKKYGRVIFDNTHAFYARPMKGAYNVYSCRKFFGVPDGGYLVCDKFLRAEVVMKQGRSYGSSLFLLKAHDTSTNEAYGDSLENEARISSEGAASMSMLTLKILQGIDYDYCMKKRGENYRELCGRLNAINEIIPPPQ